MKKIKILGTIFLIFTSIGFAEKLPVAKEEYAFKVYDISNIGMGYSKISQKNKSGMDTNPASIALLKESYLEIGYTYSDKIDIFSDEMELNKKIDYIGLSTSTGGFYYKSFSKKGSIATNEKYDFNLKEIGVVITQKSENKNGLYSGLTLKGYYGNILEGSLDNKENIDLTIDRGYGIGIDLGFLYKANFVYAGFTWKDIFSKIFWSEYDDVKINGKVSGGIGFDFGVVSYNISMEKILLDTSSMKYGHGIEMMILKLPEEYTGYILKGLEAKLRTGSYGEEIFNGKKRMTYGLELSNKNYFINNAITSEKINPFDGEDILYKAAIGMKF